jgi:hypothetical protein
VIRGARPLTHRETRLPPTAHARCDAALTSRKAILLRHQDGETIDRAIKRQHACLTLPSIVAVRNLVVTLELMYGCRAIANYGSGTASYSYHVYRTCKLCIREQSIFRRGTLRSPLQTLCYSHRCQASKKTSSTNDGQAMTILAPLCASAGHDDSSGRIYFLSYASLWRYDANLSRAHGCALNEIAAGSTGRSPAHSSSAIFQGCYPPIGTTQT